MDLWKINLILLLFILPSTRQSSTSTTEKFQIMMTEKPTTEIHPSSPNKTIDKLVQEQTDLIKQIISSHKATTIDYPIVTRKEAEVKDIAKTKQEKEQQSIEDLRKKCQELSKLLANNSNAQQTIGERSETNIDRITTVEAFGPNLKPEFLQKPKVDVSQLPKLPSHFSSPTQVELMTKNYFIVTRNRTAVNNQTISNSKISQKLNPSQIQVQSNSAQLNTITPKPQNLVSQAQNVQYQTQPNIKYMRLEPVILQRMVLNDGKMLFYWYKSLPAIPHFVSAPKHPGAKIHPNTQPYPLQIDNTQVPQPQISNTQIESSQIASSELHSLHVTNDQNQKYTPQISNTQNYQTYASNHEQKQPENIPNYEIEYGTTEKSDANLYNKQMKFIIPMPYPSNGDAIQSPIRYPWQFDPYAYYPRTLQPATMNVPVPYVPFFHMIKTLRLPENIKTSKNA